MSRDAHEVRLSEATGDQPDAATNEATTGGELQRGSSDQDEVQKQIDEAAAEEAREGARREKEARAQALTLEIVGDLPFAEVKPPENVLFVCKLNPVTEDDDLDTIFSRFGHIVSCEVIRDKRTGDSLQYAFIEFENQKDSEQAYFKMQGVLIDDHRIHVDFSQSVSRLSDKWRNVTNMKRAKGRGGFGGEASLEKKRHYRAAEDKDGDRGDTSGHNMLFDKGDVQHKKASPERGSHHRPRPRSRSWSRSRSPKRNSGRRDRSPKRNDWRRDERNSRYRDDYDERRRRR